MEDRVREVITLYFSRSRGYALTLVITESSTN